VVVIALLLTLVIGILLESKTRGGHDSEESSRSRVVNRVVKLGKDLKKLKRDQQIEATREAIWHNAMRAGRETHDAEETAIQGQENADLDEEVSLKLAQTAMHQEQEALTTERSAMDEERKELKKAAEWLVKNSGGSQNRPDESSRDLMNSHPPRDAQGEAALKFIETRIRSVDEVVAEDNNKARLAEGVAVNAIESVDRDSRLAVKKKTFVLRTVKNARGCVDLPGNGGGPWHDRYHHPVGDCAMYGASGWCEVYGGDDKNPEGRGNDKCCACGGGDRSQ